MWSCSQACEREMAEFTIARVSPLAPVAETARQVNRLTGWRIRGRPPALLSPRRRRIRRANRGTGRSHKVARRQWPEFQGEAQALPARLRLAPRFDGLPDRALVARILRAFLRLHGPVPCGGLAPL